MRSYLVVGNQTLTGPELAAAIAERMVPVTRRSSTSSCRRRRNQGAFTWDEDEANAAAQERLDALLGHLRGLGLEATGEVGHATRSRPRAMRSGAIRSTRSSSRPCRRASRAGSGRTCRRGSRARWRSRSPW